MTARSYLVFPRHIPAGEFVSVSASCQFGYESARMLYGNPRRPTRTVDDAAWNTVYDAGANGLYVADTALYRGNGHGITIALNAANTWGAPSVSVAPSTVAATIAAANRTLSGSKITLINGATLTAHAHKGGRLRFGTSDTQHAIHDNGVGWVSVNGTDISGQTGDVQILSGAGWVTFAEAAHRYLLVNVAAQDTVEEYHELQSVVIGLRTELPDNWYAPLAETQPVTPWATKGGGHGVLIDGPPMRSWALTGLEIGDALFDELSARIRTQGAAPIAFVPDSTRSHDWALVLPSFDVAWDFGGPTVIRLDEVV